MIHRAIIFASVAHQGQLRKGTDLPYIIHPLEVAQILSRAGASDTALVTGLLHDVLEDTQTSFGKIKTEFGNHIAQNVLYCTNYCTGPWCHRKKAIIAKIAECVDVDLASVLCADKLSNLRSICFDYNSLGEALWSRFSTSRENIFWYYETLGKVICSNSAIPLMLKKEYCLLLDNILKGPS